MTAFGDFLRLKYGSHRFDLVIAMDDSTIEFLDQVRDELFPATPIVFFSTRSSPRRVPNSTGVTAELNLASSLELAVQLQPDLRHVFVVSGAEAANRVNVGMAREQFRSFESRLEFTYLTGLPTEELERRLASLPAHSIVYFLVVYRDGQDENFEPLAYLRRVADVANAPTYCWVDSAMDQGIVGGSLRSQPAQVEAVGALALRVLRGGAGRQHPDRAGGPECRAGGLAAAAAVEHQRGAHPRRHANSLPRTDASGIGTGSTSLARSRCCSRRPR